MAHLVVQVVERCEKAQESQHLGNVLFINLWKFKHFANDD